MVIQATNTPHEILAYDRNLEHVFKRYQIDVSCDAPLNDLSTQSEFITSVLNCFCLDESAFEELKLHPVPVLVDYLRRSHDYYLSKRMPEIAQTMMAVCYRNEKSSVIELLFSFFESYSKELKSHFAYEEEFLFPYAEQLYASVVQNAGKENELFNYSVKEFLQHHHDQTERELSEVQQALLNYSSSGKNDFSLHVLISKLKNFQHDLEIHANVEEHILVPKLAALENELLKG